MNPLERSGGNAANAPVDVACPWCAEPVRATDQELADGLACSACNVVVRLEWTPIAADRHVSVRAAA